MANFIVLRFDAGVVNSAIGVVIKHKLRTLDAIQLAFVLKLKDYKPVLISFDEELNRAARGEDLEVVGTPK